MLEPAKDQRFISCGLLSALLMLSGQFGGESANAASLHRSTSTPALSGTQLAQAGNAAPDSAPVGDGAPAGRDGPGGEDVPFSELNEALTTARSKLAELTKAAEIAKVAGELREQLQATEAENRQLKSVLSQLQTQNSDLLSGTRAAKSRIEELQKGTEASTAEAKRLDEELVSMRWQNSQLSNSLAEAETTARERADALDKMREELGARAESLTATVDESAAEITRLQRELDEAQGKVVAAERQRAASLTELEELKKATAESTSDSARLARDLDGTITELADTRERLATTQGAFEEANVELKAAKGENSLLREQLSGNRSEADRLRTRLETVEAELSKARTLNAGLEQQVDILKAAAGDATDAARQNLLAVEDQINEINAALASVKADELLPRGERPALGGNGAGSSTAGLADQTADGDWVPRPSPPRAAFERQLIAATAAAAIESTTAAGRLAATANRPQDDDAADSQEPAINLAALTTDLPEDRRRYAESLLSRLGAEEDSRGLSMTVPGELLFAVDSEKIEPEAFDALARVAELVKLYDGRDVLIVGHTDAVGNADYNKKLSERRAALVKKYFVDKFRIGPDRLQIEGMGEKDPITSNETADGRNANRRVEVVILK